MQRKLPEVVGVAEIAKLLGISRQRVNVILYHPEFPKPIASLSCGRIWRTSDIQQYAKQRRGPGRPRRA